MTGDERPSSAPDGPPSWIKDANDYAFELAQMQIRDLQDELAKVRRERDAYRKVAEAAKTYRLFLSGLILNNCERDFVDAVDALPEES